MKLLIQPDDGIESLIKAIGKAKKSVEVVIFRFDHREMETALANAAKRGVDVQALIASTNRGGERGLRKLEMRLLAAGVGVARTATDLVRYHGKMMIIDRRELCILGFNFTHLDIDRSRSFGVVTSNRRLVQEAEKLFEADAKRKPYTPGLDTFIVSPVNARKQLSAFVKGAKKELLIYDPEISDPSIVRLLEERSKAGVRIKAIGGVTKRATKIEARKIQTRLHTRTIIRDGQHAFIGSQSLRHIELDARREVGVIFRDRKVVSALHKTFHEDWESVKHPISQDVKKSAESHVKVAKRVAKAVADDLPPMTSLVKGMVNQVTGKNGSAALNVDEVQETIKAAVKDAVKELVRDAVEEAS